MPPLCHNVESRVSYISPLGFRSSDVTVGSITSIMSVINEAIGGASVIVGGASGGGGEEDGGGPSRGEYVEGG
jgi:hypothetical protein